MRPTRAPAPPTFRPTVWPAEPPDVPPVMRYLLADADGVVRVVDVDREREQAELPPDFVLQELLAVGEGRDSLVAFMREWGLLVDLPAEGGQGLDLDEAGRRLRTLQLLARHVLADRNRDFEGVQSAWRSLFGETPQSRGQAWSWFKSVIDPPLTVFHVHIRLIGYPDAAPQGNLYNAIALQLTKYAEGAPIALCANERCRNPFTVQRSARRRYKGTEHGSGVRYCSHLCARAQSERERRARRRAHEEQSS